MSTHDVGRGHLQRCHLTASPRRTLLCMCVCMRLCLGNVGLWVCDQACVWIVWIQEEAGRAMGRGQEQALKSWQWRCSGP